MKKSCLFAVSALLLLLGGCYGDKGNYDYREINEIVIGARGFEGVEYKLRSGIDELKISPYITASQDPGLTGSYEYEWVVVGQVRNPGERTTIARTRDLDYAVNLPSDDYSLLLRITDPATGLMFSRSTTISVSTAYTRGWLVAAEDEEGAAVVDMVSISRDTLLQRDVVRDDTRPPQSPAHLVRQQRVHFAGARAHLPFDRRGEFPLRPRIFRDGRLYRHAQLLRQSAVPDGDRRFGHDPDRRQVPHLSGGRLRVRIQHFFGQHGLFRAIRSTVMPRATTTCASATGSPTT